MIKILYVNGGTMDRGGVSTFMMNVYEKMNSEKIQIDFLVHTLSKGVRDEDILNLGGKFIEFLLEERILYKITTKLSKLC